MTENRTVSNLIDFFESHYDEFHDFMSTNAIYQDFSPEQLNVINIHPELFFKASKTRVVLVVWICKTLRKTFELYGYVDLDLQTEAYDIMRTQFRTKAFNRTNYLALFDNKNILSYSEFVDFEKKYIMEYNKYAKENISLLQHIKIRPQVPTLKYEKELSDILNSDRITELIYMRSQGKTLDFIGEQLGITRERTRQLEFKPKNDIERLLALNESSFLNDFTSNCLLSQEKIEKEIGPKYWAIMKYVIISNNNTQKLNWKYFEPLDLIYFHRGPDLDTVIDETKKQLETEIPSNLISAFTEKIKSQGFSFWNENFTKNYFKSDNFKIYNSKSKKEKITIKGAIELVARSYFPSGIKATNIEDLNLFVKKVNGIFNFHVKSDRAFVTRIQNTLVMIDKGTYCSSIFLKCDPIVVTEINKYIKEMKEDKISYKSLFLKFENLLRNKSNILNYSYLHGALKYFAENNKTDYICERYYVRKINSTQTKSKEFFKTFYDFLKENPGPHKIDDLLLKFPNWNKMYFRYSTNYFEDIVQWSKNEYCCISSIQYPASFKSLLEQIIEENTNNQYGYTSSYLIFNILKKKNPSILNNFNIKNNSQLYYIISYLFKDKYFCKKPHILKNYKKEKFTSQELINEIIEGKKIINKNEIINEIAILYGSKENSISLIFQKNLQEYIKISEDNYIHKSKLKLTPKNIETIKSLIKGKSSLQNIEYSCLPHIGINWTPTLLKSIINIYNIK